MSYILDALRKSDEQRRRGTTPTLLTPQVAQVAPARRKSLPYWMTGGALLVAGVLIGALRPWQSAPPAPASAPLVAPAATPAATAPMAAAAPADQAKPPVAPVHKAAPAPRAAVAPPPVAKSAEKTVVDAEREARPRGSPRETVASAAKSPPKPPASAPPEQPTVKFSELPVEVQLEIPKLQITVHAYSPIPRERLVGINDLLLREGGSVSPDLKLEQITPDGMVMTYKGYRFRRGVR